MCVLSLLLPGARRGPDGRKLTAFQAATETFRAAGKTMPEVVFWNLSGGGRGVPVVATQPRAVLVSGFSAALVKDILEGGAVDPLALVERVVASPAFAPLALPGASAEDAERVVRGGLALEGRDARRPEEPPAAHPFAELGEEWELVRPAEAEAEAVEAAAPRRAPLLSVRGVRLAAPPGDGDAAEDALLALIGKGGSRVKEARDVLSAAAASLLRMRARVWLDAERVGDRLGALAVTVSARAPEAALRQALAALLLPAADALVARVSRSPEEAERRKRWWEEDAAAEFAPRVRERPVPLNEHGEMPYHETRRQLETAARPERASDEPFLPLEEVPSL